MLRSSLFLCACLPITALANNPTPLEDMTILGDTDALPRIAGSAHRIDAETLNQYAYDDINRVLNQVPGVYLREEDGFGLRPNIGLRGANSDRSQKVTLLEDGVLFGPAPYAAPAAYFFPLTSRMSGVEVFKGPAAIQHGPQTVGGAINLISTPIPDSFAGRVGLAGGSDGYRRAYGHLGGPVGSFGLSAEAVHVASDGFKRIDGGGDSGFSKNELQLKAAHAIGPGQLELRVGYADEVSDETYLGLSQSDFDANPDRRYRASALDRMEWDWNGVRADWRQPAWGGHMHLTAYSHDFQRAWRKFNNFGGADIRDVLANPDTPSNRLLYQVLTGEADSNPQFEGDDLRIGTNDRNFRSSGLQGRLNWGWKGNAEHQLEVGARLHSDRITRLHDDLAYEMAAGELVRNAVPRTITANNTARGQSLAVWLLDTIEIGRWSLAPGLRIEHVRTEFANRLVAASNSDSYTVVLPGLGLNYTQSETLRWLAGLHRGFSPASPGLTDDVEPEIALNFEAGARWYSPLGRVEAIGFYSDYDNLTAICTFSSGCDDSQLGQQTNAGSVEVLGLELLWSLEPELNTAISLPLNLSYTYTQGEFGESFNSSNPQYGEVREGFELPYVPEHRANLRAGLRGLRWLMEMSVTYVSAMRDTAGSGAIPAGSGTDAHTVIDLSARWTINTSLALNARIDNLADERFVAARRPFGARPGKPRSGQIGLDWSF